MNVTYTQFRSILRAQPFQPFVVHVADGRQLEVPHPEFASMLPSGRAVIIIHPDDSYDMIDLLLITSLEVKPGAEAESTAS